MSYYYQNHIRNLEEQALLEKRKIAAELYEKDLIEANIRESSYRKQVSLKRSRKEQEKQTAAYLQRSRLSAELSAMRVKAENTMNRSRIQAAFQIRRQNQKAIQELQKMNQRHAILQQQTLRQKQIAKFNYQTSRRVAEELYKQEKILQSIANSQNLKLEEELNTAHRISQILKQRYYPY